MNCTCGANSVNSVIHSAWCDVITIRALDPFHFLLTEADRHPYSRFYYVCTGEKIPLVRFEEFKNFLQGGWAMTGEIPGIYTVFTHNGSEIIFIGLRDKDYMRGVVAKGVLIEDHSNMQVDDLWVIVPALVAPSNGWCKMVDPLKMRVL